MNLKKIALNSGGETSGLKKTYASLIFQQSGLCMFSVCVCVSKQEILRMLK